MSLKLWRFRRYCKFQLSRDLPISHSYLLCGVRKSHTVFLPRGVRSLFQIHRCLDPWTVRREEDFRDGFHCPWQILSPTNANNSRHKKSFIIFYYCFVPDIPTSMPLEWLKMEILFFSVLGVKGTFAACKTDALQPLHARVHNGTKVWRHVHNGTSKKIA